MPVALVNSLAESTERSLAGAVAFFRKIKSRGGVLSLPDIEATELLKTFIQDVGAECCGTDQLFALSELALHAKNEKVAIEALTRALLLSEKSDRANYRLGRIDLIAKRYDAANRHFERGILANPEFPLNWLGQALALHALGQRVDALNYAERFAGFGVAPPGKKELGFIGECADALFDAGERARSAPLYKLLHTLAEPSPKIVVRFAEALLAARRSDDALAVLRVAHHSSNLDAWGRRALAHCESLAGNHSAAIAIAVEALSERPDDQGFVSTYIEAVLQARDTRVLRDAVVGSSGILPPEGLHELQARLHLADNNVVGAFDALQSIDIMPRSRIFWLAVDVAYAAMSSGDTMVAMGLAVRLQAVAGDEIAPFLIHADLLFREQMWEEASAVLQRVPQHRAREPQVLLKLFELACFTRDDALAIRLQSELDGIAPRHREAILPVLRFLAEQQEWPELVRRALAWLGADFRYEQVGYVLYRAARRTRRHADFLAAIEAIPGWGDSADLNRLHTALAWDHASSVVDVARLGVTTQASTIMRKRMLVQQRISARARRSTGRRSLFLCTDAAYLCATLVALHSALMSSKPGAEDVFLVVDDEIARLATRVTEPFRLADYSVSIVPASEVVGAAERLYPAYGLFTSGHVLASAAYYRIFFASYLQKTGEYGRALYVDSDVLIRTSLDALYEAPLNGHPLAARLERARPEVKRAVALHQLEDGRYFNSGVLLFDTGNEHLAAALDRAIAAIADEHVTLLFHDQCALNLGFRSCFEPLDTAWNMPVTERSDAADVPPEVGILHYLDRPKPWSAAYEGSCATFWLEQWSRTAEFIGEANALEVFQMSGD